MDISNWIFGGLAAGFLYRQLRPTLAVRQVSARDLERWLAGPDGKRVQVVDVRSPEEYRHGHLSSSLSIPLGELRARVQEIAREGEVVLVCRSGYRAMQAYHILRRRRYGNCWVLRGGILAWQAHRRTAAPDIDWRQWPRPEGSS